MIPNSAEISIAERWTGRMIPIGAYKNPELSVNGETTEDVYANCKIKKVSNGDELKIAFDLHEFTNDKYKLLQLGLVELENGTVVDEIEKILPNDWGYDFDRLLKYGNEDGTKVAISEVKATIAGVETALVEGTDYESTVTITGATAIKFLSGGVLTDDSPFDTSISIKYSAVADNTKVVTHSKSGIARPIVAIVEFKYIFEGEEFIIKKYLENVTAEKSEIKAHSDDDKTTAGMPIVLTGIIVKDDKVGFDV